MNSSILSYISILIITLSCITTSISGYEFGLAYPRKVSDIRWNNPSGLVGFKGTNLYLKWNYNGEITSSSTVKITYTPAAGPNKGVVTTVVTGYSVGTNVRRLDSSSSSSEHYERLLPLAAYTGSGSYNWAVPANFPVGGQYWFTITIDGGSGSTTLLDDGTKKHTDVL